MTDLEKKTVRLKVCGRANEILLQKNNGPR